MANIIVENVPENIIKLYWTNVIYDNIDSSFIPKKRKINRLKWLSKEEIDKDFYDEKNETYWPFIWEENITFLKSLVKWK